jgi:hypothetical protein
MGTGAHITILHDNDEPLVTVSKAVVVLHHVRVAQVGQHLDFVPHLHIKTDLSITTLAQGICLLGLFAWIGGQREVLDVWNRRLLHEIGLALLLPVANVQHKSGASSHDNRLGSARWKLHTSCSHSYILSFV